jgi:hypothetical protein
VLRRLRLCGLVLVGQFVGIGLSILLFIFFASLARVFPIVDSPAGLVIACSLGVVMFPILGSYWIVKCCSNYSWPLIVSICGYLLPAAFGFALIMSTRGRQAMGTLFSPWFLTLLAAASVVGSYFAMCIAGASHKRAG